MRPQQQVMRGDERQPNVRLTERQAAQHCLYFERGLKDPVAAFSRWARRQGIPVKRAGRARIYETRILDAFMDGADWTQRHAGGRKRARLRVVHARQSVGESR